jgi:hypothetical protein
MISVADLGLGAGFGCIVGLALGAYLKGLFGKAGEIDANSGRMEQIAAKAFREAFEGEAGKRLASRQDIENVLDELRKVTRETETIKAEITSDQWLRQTVWIQKREAYTALLKVLTDLHDSFTEFTASLACFESGRTDPDAADYETRKFDLLKKRETTLDVLFQLSLRFGEAALFDPGISEQQKKFRGNYGLNAAIQDTATSAETKEFVLALMQFRRELLSHMRRELGIPELSNAVSP